MSRADSHLRMWFLKLSARRRASFYVLKQMMHISFESHLVIRAQQGRSHTSMSSQVWVANISSQSQLNKIRSGRYSWKHNSTLFMNSHKLCCLNEWSLVTAQAGICYSNVLFLIIILSHITMWDTHTQRTSTLQPNHHSSHTTCTCLLCDVTSVFFFLAAVTIKISSLTLIDPDGLKP